MCPLLYQAIVKLVILVLLLRLGRLEHTYICKYFDAILSIYLYNKTRHSHIYMLPIAAQTAGPIWAEFFCGHS